MKQSRNKPKEEAGEGSTPRPKKAKEAAASDRNGASVARLDTSAANGELPDAFFVKDKSGLQRIDVQDIIFLQADLNYVELVLEGQRHVLRNSLSELLERLPADRFHRVNRSAAINLAHVDLIDGSIIHLGPHRVSLSRSLRNEFLKRLHIISGR